MKKFFALILVVALLAISATTVFAGNGTGFDQYGYNDNGNIFNGTGLSWCMAGGGTLESCGVSMAPYASDQLVMKWNEAWDACNANGYNDPVYCAGAWTSNQWNGAFPGGSGEVWHYKMIWVGAEQWNVAGTWNALHWYNGVSYTHVNNITQASDGTLTGSGGWNGYVNGAPTSDSNTWVLTNGSKVIGNTLRMNYTYTSGAVCDGWIDAAINADGSMTGTWNDYCWGQNRSGSWTTPSGVATSNNGPYWKNGGYRIWNNYEVIMDQGMSDGAHEWLAHATPNGYGK